MLFGRALSSRGSSLSVSGRYAEALPWFEQSLAYLKRARQDREAATLDVTLSDVHESLGEPVAAWVYRRRAHVAVSRHDAPGIQRWVLGSTAALFERREPHRRRDADA